MEFDATWLTLSRIVRSCEKIPAKLHPAHHLPALHILSHAFLSSQANMAEEVGSSIAKGDYGISFGQDLRFAHTHDQFRVRPGPLPNLFALRSVSFGPRLVRSLPASSLPPAFPVPCLTCIFSSLVLPNPIARAQWCWTLYNDYLRCKDKLGEDAERTKYILSKARSICPSRTFDKYEEAVAEGKWWGYQAGSADGKPSH